MDMIMGIGCILGSMFGVFILSACCGCVSLIPSISAGIKSLNTPSQSIPILINQSFLLILSFLFLSHGNTILTKVLLT